MKKKVTILIIDDTCQDTTTKAIQAASKRKCDVEFITILTRSEELRQDNSDHLDPLKLEQQITKFIEHKKINWAFTDLDLGETDVDGLKVVEILQKIRSNIKIYMYSGNITAVVKKVLNKEMLSEANEAEIVDAVRKLMGYKIIDFISRSEYKDELIKLINHNEDPTVQDFFVEQLYRYGDMEFKSCFSRFNGRTFSEIAKMIEAKSNAQTDEWTKELVEQAIAYLVKVNE